MIVWRVVREWGKFWRSVTCRSPYLLEPTQAEGAYASLLFPSKKSLFELNFLVQRMQGIQALACNESLP